MSIQGEIDRINQNIADTYSVLSDAGAATPDAANSENLAATAAGIAAVLYNKAQGLTDTQKEQARTNIGALAESELDNAVNDALEQAKESGDFKGETGAAGPAGTSVTVSSVSESTADGGTNVVTFSDGKTLNIKNGSKGSDGSPGADGSPGTDGVSPTVAVATITGGHRITVTDKNGSRSFDVLDGNDGQDGGQGAAGEDGKDGTSVTVTNVSESNVDGGTNVVTFSDGKKLNIKNGSKGSDGAPGADGSPGAAGKDGTSVTVSNVSESTADGGTNVVTFSDGKKLNVKNGSKGSAGSPGATGPAGRGVQSMTYNSSTNKWTITYTDGTTSSVTGPAIPDVSAYMPKSGGTFTGSVQAGAASTSGYYVRNIKFSTAAETPTTEGDICFKLK